MVSKIYDGVWLKNRAIYAWDAESFAWFNTRMLSIDKIVDIKKGCHWGEDEDEWGIKEPYSLVMAQRIAQRYLCNHQFKE